jgi:hypothetical protein
MAMNGIVIENPEETVNAYHVRNNGDNEIIATPVNVMALQIRPAKTAAHIVRNLGHAYIFQFEYDDFLRSLNGTE